MKQYTFHIVGNAHLPISRRYAACAFGMKAIRLSEMLLDLGHKTIMYGALSDTGDIPPCTEFVKTHRVSDIAADYGDGDNREEICYKWKQTGFRHDWNTQRKPSTLKFYANAMEGINRAKQPDHFLLLMQGTFHKPIADAVKLFLTCEPGVGYRGSYSRFRAFESSYIQNFTYGSEHPRQSINGNYYDRVIPNYFDPADFEFRPIPADYYLYIGRLILRKGVLTAAKTCETIGAKLIIAGQGGRVDGKGVLHGEDFTLKPGTWEYIGYVEPDRRRELFGGAIATFVPTQYLEPFAGVHIESMLCGVPAITTNFGVFPETIPTALEGIVGYRCNVLRDFVMAARLANGIDRQRVRSYSERFLMDNVKYEFQRWFDDLYQLYLSTDDKTPGWSFLGAA